MFHKIFFILLIVATINLVLSRSKPLPKDTVGPSFFGDWRVNNVRIFFMIYKKNYVLYHICVFKSFFKQGMQRTREAMENLYNALKNLLPRTFKQCDKQIDEGDNQECDKQIDEGDNQEYWMRLKKNLPKLQTTFPSSSVSLSSNQEIFKGMKNY